jgi:hypothetical protein
LRGEIIFCPNDIAFMIDNCPLPLGPSRHRRRRRRNFAKQSGRNASADAAAADDDEIRLMYARGPNSRQFILSPLKTYDCYGGGQVGRPDDDIDNRRPDNRSLLKPA